MSCPKCGSNKIGLGGTYNVKRTTIKIVRLRCKRCEHSFVRKNLMYRKKKHISIRKKILKLWKTKKLDINKYYATRKKTYSTREIARMLNVSKTYVWSVVKSQDKIMEVR